MLESLIVLETNSSPLRKNQNISLCRILAFQLGILPYWSVLEQHYTIHQHSYHLAWCLLRDQILLWPYWFEAEFLTFTSYHLQAEFFWGKHHDTYCPIPKSGDQATTSLQFLASDSIASSQSSIFSHLIFHFRNLWYKLSFTIQSTFFVFLCMSYTFVALLVLGLLKTWKWAL